MPLTGIVAAPALQVHGIDFFDSVGRMKIDGEYHNDAKQRCVDTTRARACEQAGVTLIRITNDEVFGDREILLKKLRGHASGTAPKQELISKRTAMDLRPTG
jgi:very-short-patch-repair endonuclease